MTSDLARRLAPWIALALLSAIVLALGPHMCRQADRQRAEIRLGKEQQGAATESGRDAIETVGEAAARERSNDELSGTNRREIENAEGADIAVGRAVHDAGIDSLCRRAAYRHSERCRVRRAAAP